LIADEQAARVVSFEAVEGCVEHPELSVDALGDVVPRTFDDGSLFGIVDTHSHILSNFAFGGGGIFHGAPFHRLGVEHALSDCEQFHGKAGRKDIFGYAFNGGGALDAQTLLPLLLFGELGQDDHHTAGYPDFTDWPNAPFSSTHQTQYYRWLERAYLAGLRLVIQHATSNEVICDFMVGEGYQDVRYSCNDMVAVDRILEETRNMERYIDAQAGGPGKGFFRIVDSPAQAREVIARGKMAVVLGIETSNLFDCLSVPRAGMPTCDEQYVREQLDAYHARGVRVLFPVHKYDNAFSAGDGHRDFIELGNFINSGHYSNFVQDCPADITPVFDKGDVAFGGLNEPRDEYDSPPPNDMTRFRERPVRTLAPHLGRLTGSKLKGDYCQKTGLTPLGETLLREMMLRGMVIEIDHFPRRSYQRALELLEELDYPAAGTHGSTQNGRLYALGGISKTGLGRCRSATRKGAMLDGLRSRLGLIEKVGGYPAEGFGFDLNGFAGAPGPRFGERSRCSDPQEDPVGYPFTSYAGDITFTEPRIGNRTLDFNTEGFVHVGMLPELIQDARGDAESDAELEPLFRSAEGYLRMWERAEGRAAELRTQVP
jgi:microsomal dipeptidase-like Zn-dependent dipeptidase